jgi:2-polyprenyl-6-methoxyphenol hydroxylase-like FAD-dependent oxidoreductase
MLLSSAPHDVDLVIGADGHHSGIRELVFGPESQFMHHLGAYLSIYTINNVLDLRDRTVLYNEPQRFTGMGWETGPVEGAHGASRRRRLRSFAVVRPGHLVSARRRPSFGLPPR